MWYWFCGIVVSDLKVFRCVGGLNPDALDIHGFMGNGSSARLVTQSMGSSTETVTVQGP